MTLENFGCGGATTTSILDAVGCGALAADGVAYPSTTQAAAAVSFINEHHGHIGLITISIGGNDFDGCINQPLTCVTAAMPLMMANIETLTARLRGAAGASVPMIAITYPDVVLGLWTKGAAFHATVLSSITGFKTVINPSYVVAYRDSKVSFVDVTSATGAYIPLRTTTVLKPYGRIPVAVADVCTLTWFCAREDIHPKTKGYGRIAALIATRYIRLVG
jgi:lysophospholipase L1-like esterase